MSHSSAANSAMPIVTPRGFDAHDINFDLGSDSGAVWSDVMLEHHGMYCHFDEARSINSTAQSWSLGEVGVTLADLSSLALMPVGEERASWQGEWLYLKLMTGGQVDISQAGQQRRFKAGSMFMIDPAWSFQESFTERGQMTVLRIPKAALRDRGLRHSLADLVTADMNSPDMCATRDLIHCIAQQHVAPSPIIRNLMGRQLLELVDAILGGAGDTFMPRSAEVVLLRAKRYIHLNLGNSGLDSAAVAGAAHVSVKHLQRLFRARNTTVMRHVWTMRLEHAKQLLSSGRGPGLSVQDVAWQCGFATAAHFSRAYRAHFDICPSQVRV